MIQYSPKSTSLVYVGAFIIYCLMSEKELYIVLNLKEYTTLSYLSELKDLLSSIKIRPNIKVILCPALQYLMSPIVQELAQYASICAQRVDYTNGTGKIRPGYLSESNCTYSLCGHADHHPIILANQIQESIENRIIPIAFVQTIHQIFPISEPHIWVYEPHNRIGATGAEPIESIISFVSDVKKEYGEKELVLYGGSVNQDNFAEIIKHTNGVCMGRTSRNLGELRYMLMNLVIEVK